MSGMEIAEFLLARIAEDEATACEALPGSHLVEPNSMWNPVRVLADLASKRQIVEGIREATSGPVTEYYIGPMMTTDTVLELLALAYADHPDYDPAWRV